MARCATLPNFGGCQRLPCETFLSVTLNLETVTLNVETPMVLCPVDCPGEVHYTTIVALRNGKIFKIGGVTHPQNPLSFVPHYGSMFAGRRINVTV